VSAGQERHDDRQNLAVRNELLDFVIEERVVDSDSIGQKPIGLRLVDENSDLTEEHFRLNARDFLAAGHPDILPHPVEIIRGQIRMRGGILEDSVHDRLGGKRHKIGDRAANVAFCDLRLVPKHQIVPQMVNHGAQLMRCAAERIGKNLAIVAQEVRALLIQICLLHAAFFVRRGTQFSRGL
jgi:hypothetical protein